MKKFSLLLGTLGGAMAGYLLSNQRLREELTKAKTAEAAAKVLGAHLSRDGKKIAKEVKTIAESEEVQRNLKKARQFAAIKFAVAKKNVEKFMKSGAKTTTKAVKKGATRVAKAAKGGFRETTV